MMIGPNYCAVIARYPTDNDPKSASQQCSHHYPNPEAIPRIGEESSKYSIAKSIAKPNPHPLSDIQIADSGTIQCPFSLKSMYKPAVNCIATSKNRNPHQRQPNNNRHSINNHCSILNRPLQLSSIFSNINNYNVFYKNRLFPQLLQLIIISVAILLIPLRQVNADSSVCSIQQFQCGPNYSCIPLSQKCDGFRDCPDNSDENNCPMKKCSSEEFSCANGKCIEIGWHCDRQNDCGDNSDELECEMTCQPYQYKCDISNQCIDKVAVCDGIENCDDGSDEHLSACLFHRPVCEKGQFLCTNGHCIPNSLVCDKQNDCGDNSDETLPKCSNADSTVTCLDHEFRCRNDSRTKCISIETVCDNTNDCEFGEDEVNCPEPVDNHLQQPDNGNNLDGNRCNPGQFECHNLLECMDQKLVCDRIVDCSDGSDELNCDYSCSADQFQCANQQLCISLSMVCDGIAECSDQSDEFNCTYTTSIPRKSTTVPTIVSNDTTEYSNKTIQNSTECADGFRFDTDQQICNDIDECAEDYSLCSGHRCNNTEGSFECCCQNGFQLVKQQFCVRNISADDDRTIQNSMIYSTQNQLQLLKWSTEYDWTNSSEDVGNLTVQNQSELFNIKYSNQSIIFDYNIHSNYYVASDMEGQFYIDRLDKGRELSFDISTPSVFIGKDTTVRSMAIDWINHLLLFINKRHRRIEALKLSKLSTVYILVPNLDRPQDIEVNPFESWFVWSDIFGGKARICQCAYNGSFGKILVNKDISHPTGLSIDHTIRRIFWLDGGTNSISSIDYNGNDRRLVLQSEHFVGEPFDIDVLDNNVYWSDRKTNAVYTCNKFGNVLSNDNQLKIRRLFSTEQVSTIAIVDRYKQPTMSTDENRCSLACPFACSQTTVCQCPANYKLINDRCVNSTIELNETKLIIKSKSFDFVNHFSLFYLIIAVVVIIAFCVPYLFKFMTSYLRNKKRNYRWVKLNNLNESLAAKAIRLNSSTSSASCGDNSNSSGKTTVIDRLDDVSSGYSSITEQISDKQDTATTAEASNDDEDRRKFII